MKVYLLEKNGANPISSASRVWANKCDALQEARGGEQITNDVPLREKLIYEL